MKRKIPLQQVKLKLISISSKRLLNKRKYGIVHKRVYVPIRLNLILFFPFAQLVKVVKMVRGCGKIKTKICTTFLKL